METMSEEKYSNSDKQENEIDFFVWIDGERERWSQLPEALKVKIKKEMEQEAIRQQQLYGYWKFGGGLTGDTNLFLEEKGNEY